MKKRVIDTNALISFVTDRNPDQQEKAAAIFEDAARLKATILCPQNVLTEFVYGSVFMKKDIVAVVSLFF